MKRVELVLYFDNNDDAHEFVKEHIGVYANEPAIAPKVNGWAVYEVGHPKSNTSPEYKTLRAYYDRKTAATAGGGE